MIMIIGSFKNTIRKKRTYLNYCFDHSQIKATRHCAS